MYITRVIYLYVTTLIPVFFMGQMNRWHAELRSTSKKLLYNFLTRTTCVLDTA
eukprot:COSAG01_NODE_6656_length_3560_cov_7.561398_2_plen_53_part_00